MPECHVSFLMDLMIVKPLSFKLCCIVSIVLGICAIFLHKKCVLLRKSACPFGQVKTEMYLPESPFFKNSLARASGLVLMSNPGLMCLIAIVWHLTLQRMAQKLPSVHVSAQLSL